MRTLEQIRDDVQMIEGGIAELQNTQCDPAVRRILYSLCETIEDLLEVQANE